MNTKTVSKETAQTALVMADQNAHKALMVSSAKACVLDASETFARKDYTASVDWSLRSLSYSLGVFHADYVFVCDLLGR